MEWKQVIKKAVPYLAAMMLGLALTALFEYFFIVDF
jgi:hypothetical protein